MDAELTTDEQTSLDYVRFKQARLLRDDVWVNPFMPPGVSAEELAAQRGWYLNKRDELGTKVPDGEKAQPILEKLVSLGRLVLLDHFMVDDAKVAYYATPDFLPKYVALWKMRLR